MAWPRQVTKADLRIDRMRGSGKGGQNRNKRDTAVRITHLPTGLVGYAEDERTQGRNRRLAFRRLAVQLIPLMKQEAMRERYAAGHRRIRTYHEPDQRVTDARVPGRRWGYDDIVHGDGLGDVIETVRLEEGSDDE